MEIGSADGEDPTAIPAASIGAIDLGLLYRSDPSSAEEIARLEGLMNRGDETDEEFLKLCRLLSDAGAVDDAEYLLRRNIDYEGGRDLYDELFGSAKINEFERAIKTFETQFGTTLSGRDDSDFLTAVFRSTPAPSQTGYFSILSKACEVTIEFAEKTTINADVIPHALSTEEHDVYVLMEFFNGMWSPKD